MSPSDLRYIPKSFQDGNGRYIIPVIRSRPYIVSHQYPTELSHALEHLGVRAIGMEEFLSDLNNFIRRCPGDFQTMSSEWHDRLSEILDSMSKDHDEDVDTLPIIPLQDGSWISASDSRTGQLIFHSRSRPSMPRSAGIFEIHPDIDRKPAWKRLMQRFGARSLSVAECCGVITTLHATDEFLERISASDIISHVKFLWEADWSVSGAQSSIWVATNHGDFCQSSQVYLPSEEPYSTSYFCSLSELEFRFLHPRYIEVLSIGRPNSNHAWRDWLHKCLDVEIYPRLAIKTQGNHPWLRIHDDFRSIMRDCKCAHILQLLKSQWYRYRDWILTREHGQDSIMSALSVLHVSCRFGTSAPLKYTFLPRAAVISGLQLSNIQHGHQTGYNTNPNSSIPLLDVPDPEDSEWDFLKKLGVTIDVSIKGIIARLRQLQRTGASKAQVASLYDLIQSSVKEEDIGNLKWVSDRHLAESLPLTL